jgi:hypothetical protein
MAIAPYPYLTGVPYRIRLVIMILPDKLLRAKPRPFV